MKTTKSLFAMIVLTLPFLAATPAAAQATRTWVSGNGDDLAACSRTAPCKTFAAAIAATAAGGEINCLDSGGFGSLTITKSITILCEGVVAGILASGTFGININAAATDTVTLKGLDIDGGGTGTFGVNVLSAAKVTILNTSIRNFRGNASAAGVIVQTSATTTVNIQDSTILYNNTGVTGSSSAGSYKIVNLKNTMITGNSVHGISLPTINLYVNVFESVISNNGNTGVFINAYNPNGGGLSVTNIKRSQINNNGVAGLGSFGFGGLINVSQSDLLNNTQAFSQGTGHIGSDGLNNVVGNVGDAPTYGITQK